MHCRHPWAPFSTGSESRTGQSALEGTSTCPPGLCSRRSTASLRTREAGGAWNSGPTMNWLWRPAIPGPWRNVGDSSTRSWATANWRIRPKTARRHLWGLLWAPWEPSSTISGGPTHRLSECQKIFRDERSLTEGNLARMYELLDKIGLHAVR